MNSSVPDTAAQGDKRRFVLCQQHGQAVENDWRGSWAPLLSRPDYCQKECHGLAFQRLPAQQGMGEATIAACIWQLDLEYT